MIRLANAALLTVDGPADALELIERTSIDYLIWDCQGQAEALELTRRYLLDGSRGYIEEFPEIVESLAPKLRERAVRLLSAAGGVNPLACAREVRRRAPGVSVAVVTAGDLTGRIDAPAAKGCPSAYPDTAVASNGIRDQVIWVSPELGAEAFERALAAGAQVVITGWPAGPALSLAAAVLRFGWRPPDWNRMAAGALAGRLLAGRARLTGLGCAGRYEPNPLDPSCRPIVELYEDGCTEIIGAGGAAGRIDVLAISLQLLAGVADPRAVETPDCTADLTHLEIKEREAGRVRITGARGRAPAESTRVWMACRAGWKVTGALLYCWPEALEKARAADRIFRRRIERLGLALEEMHTDYVGVNACLGPAAPTVDDYPEIELRIRVRGRDRQAAERCARELAALARFGPPCVMSSFGGSEPVEEVIDIRPALVPRTEIASKVEVVE